MAKRGALGATAEALRGLRIERQQEDRRDQSLIFQLAAHDPVAAERAFNQRFPEFGTVSFRGSQGKFRYFTSDQGVFAIDQKNPLRAIQVEGIPGQKKMPTGVPLKIKNRLRLKNRPVNEETVKDELFLEATETGAEKAQAEFARIQGLLAGTDKQRARVAAEIDADPFLKHSLRPVIGEERVVKPAEEQSLFRFGTLGRTEKIPVETDEFEVDEQRLQEALARKFVSQELPEGTVRLRKGEREEAPTATFEIGEGPAQRDEKVRVEITVGPNRGRKATVLRSQLDPRKMRELK